MYQTLRTLPRRQTMSGQVDVDADSAVDWKAAEIKRFITSTVWRTAEAGGKIYYYNKKTKATQWEEPDEIAAHMRLVEEAESAQQLARVLNPEVEEEVDAGVHISGVKRGLGESSSAPVRRSKQELLDIVGSRDAVMEPEAAAVAGELAELVGREQVGELLAGSYSGYQQLSRVVVEWIRKAKTPRTGAEAVDSKRVDMGEDSGTGALDVPSTAQLATSATAIATEAPLVPPMDSFGEALVADVLAEVVIQRFSRKIADDLVGSGSGSETLPDCVLHMLSQPRYREALRELYKQHPHSKLLSLCVPALAEGP